MDRKLTLEIEELEERIAPSPFVQLTVEPKGPPGDVVGPFTQAVGKPVDGVPDTGGPSSATPAATFAVVPDC